MRLIHLRDVYVLSVIALIESARRVRFPNWRTSLVQFMSQLAYVRSHHKRCLIEKNLQLAYGASISAPERACITRGAFYAFWDEMFCWADRDSSRFQV